MSEAAIAKLDVPAQLADNEIELRIAAEKTSVIDKLAEFFSDWFSPILVKETRQTLKSRQFFWTYFLLLTAVAVWTAVGLTANDASVEYGYAGASLLTGYWIVLGFPLAIVIPFGAYRSLAREYEDGTIQLISVTTMKAWQIVAGKLGSSMLQMLIYLSVIAPCIAFTYLLKGLSLPQISVGLLFCVCGCFSLCCIALFFAGATRTRFYGVGASILLLVIQSFVYWMWIMASYGLAFGELDFLASSDGIFAALGIMALLVSTGMLMFSAATVLISFEADNRSTFVRIMMLVQQTLFIGWCVSLMCYVIVPEQAIVMTFVAAHYWLIMGTVMIGEQPSLSQRVRRSLPQTTLTKSLFSFLLPGSGRGLVFAMLNIWVCGFLFLLFNVAGPEWFPNSDFGQFTGNFPRQSFGFNELTNAIMGISSVCLYSSFFLSLTYLICVALRWSKNRSVNSLTSFAIGVVLLLLFIGIAMLCHFNLLRPFETNSYSIYQLPNWYWTSIELHDNGFQTVNPFLAVFASVAMLCVCLLALLSASRELLQSPMKRPERVEQEIEQARKFEQPAPGETIDEIFSADRADLD